MEFPGGGRSMATPSGTEKPGVGGVQTGKTLRGGYGYFLEPHNANTKPGWCQKSGSSYSQWFVLGQCKPAFESFREGLSAIGMLEADKTYPDSFRPLFYAVPRKLTAERMEQLFRPNTSPVGSSKALTESLVLSRWSDYLQDIEMQKILISPWVTFCSLPLAAK